MFALAWVVGSAPLLGQSWRVLGLCLIELVSPVVAVCAYFAGFPLLAGVPVAVVCLSLARPWFPLLGSSQCQPPLLPLRFVSPFAPLAPPLPLH